MTDLLNRLDVIAASGVCSTAEASEMAQLLLRARARSRDRKTSEDAANSVTAMTSKRKAVLDVLKRNGQLTDPQLVMLYEANYGEHSMLHQTPQSIRSRRSELVRMGYVRACGKTSMESGRNFTVWETVARQA